MFAQLQDMLRAIDISENSTGNGTAVCENYLKKLSSLSRYVTPCPAILDDVGSSNNNPTNSPYTTIDAYVQPSPGRSKWPVGRGNTNCPYPECDDSDSSDESAWESLQTPTPRHMSGQWRNLIEYEASLLANHAQQSMNIPSPVGQNDLSLTRAAHQTPNIRYEASLQAEDVVEVLNSIARSLEKLGGHSCENATDMFGQYIAHRLSEMSDETRSAAEIEINRVLMKYVSKDIQRQRVSTPVQEASHEPNKNTLTSQKKKQNTK